MTGQQTFLARGALGVLAGVASIVACSLPSLRRLSSQGFDRLVTLAFPLSRFSLFGALFFLLRIAPRGDVPAYYWPEARFVLQGRLPYRDFPSSYAPLHPYLDAAVITLWHSPLAIIFLSILIETALIPLWLRFGRTLFSEATIRTAALLYLCSTVSLQFVATDGQDTVIIGVFLALAMLLLARSKELLSGLVVGISVATVKFLPLLYAPTFFLALKKRWHWTLGILLPIVAVYGSFVAMHLNVLVPLQREGGIKSAGNFPYLVESLFGISLPARLWDLLLLAVLAAIFLLVARAAHTASPETRLRVIVFAMPALTLALMIFSKKSWPPYLMLTLFPLCLLIDGRRLLQVAAFAGVGIVAVLEHSYWATFLSQLDAQHLHQGLLSGQSTYFILFAFELFLLAGYGWLLALSLRNISSSERLAPRTPSSQGELAPNFQ
ncbi:MAG TPA: hypothetical protein VL495_02595 [Edaphobacter sp.]|nr:hypothetical protein [Edaphobacter sp.]